MKITDLRRNTGLPVSMYNGVCVVALESFIVFLRSLLRLEQD